MRLALALVLLTIASPAFARDGVRHLKITATGGGDFTVEYDSRAHLTDYWCAAGNYVTNMQRMPDRTRVYRLSPPPRRAGQGISFTLDAARSAGTTGISSAGGPKDGSFSAGGAYAQFCFTHDSSR